MIQMLLLSFTAFFLYSLTTRVYKVPSFLMRIAGAQLLYGRAIDGRQANTVPHRFMSWFCGKGSRRAASVSLDIAQILTLSAICVSA
jgi:hypothetical protein